MISAPRPPTLRHRWSPRGRGGRGSSTGSGGTANTTPVGRLGGETDDGMWRGMDRCSSCLFAVRNNNKDKQAQTSINSTMKLSSLNHLHISIGIQSTQHDLICSPYRCAYLHQFLLSPLPFLPLLYLLYPPLIVNDVLPQLHELREVQPLAGPV